MAKKIGKVVGEYNNAKNQIQNEMKDVAKENFEISGPVKDERKKLETMANTLGIDFKSKTDDELKKIIGTKMGQSQNEMKTRK